MHFEIAVNVFGFGHIEDLLERYICVMMVTFAFFTHFFYLKMLAELPELVYVLSDSFQVVIKNLSRWLSMLNQSVVSFVSLLATLSLLLFLFSLTNFD